MQLALVYVYIVQQSTRHRYTPTQQRTRHHRPNVDYTRLPHHGQPSRHHLPLAY